MQFHMPTRLVFGSGVVSCLGDILKNELKAKRPFLITDPGLRQAGLVDKVVCQVDGLEIFDGVEANPKSTTVNHVGAWARDYAPDVIIALGGGSAIDAAKAIALLAANEGDIERYEGREKYTTDPLPVVAVPTTCGTASEVTWVSVITDTQRKFKMSIKGSKMFPAVAVVDPDLLLTLPASIVASTGMDALTHAIEAYTAKPATLVTDLFALKATQLIWASLPKACKDISNETVARENLMYGSTLAGFAFGNSDVGAVHCISESIGALFDIPHGVANAVFLPPVMEFNLPACESRYAYLAEIIGLEAADQTILAKKFVSAVASLSRNLKIPTFDELGIARKEFNLIARYAFQNNSNSSNIRPATQQDYLAILERAYSKD